MKTKILADFQIYISVPLRFLLNLGFLCLSLMFIKQKANACSPWTPCFFVLYMAIVTFEYYYRF